MLDLLHETLQYSRFSHDKAQIMNLFLNVSKANGKQLVVHIFNNFRSDYYISFIEA